MTIHRDISVAIGGSATNDGGMGCMRALGVRFLDDKGAELSGIGSDLARVSRIDISGIDKRIFECRFTVMCDVTNPLCGSIGEGADALYDCDITSILTIMENGMTVEYAMENAEKLYYAAAVRMFREMR